MTSRLRVILPVACIAVTSEGCGQRIGGTSPPRPLAVDRSMMCDSEPVRARTPTRPISDELPPRGSPARTIQRAVCEQFAELGVCYGDALWRDSAGAGLVTTRFVVQSDGRVDEACFLDTAINDREMLECIRERFLEIEVPEIDKTTTVVFPIDYQFLRPATSSQKPSKCERLRRDDAEADEP